MAVIAKRYAEALINTAAEENAVTKFEEQLEALLVTVSDKSLRDILDYPGINLSTKKELMKNIMDNRFDKYLVNFFMLLLDKGRQEYFNEIVLEYKKMSKQYRGILHVEVTSAVELDKMQLERIQEKVKSQYNSDNLSIKTVVDPSVIGGVKLKIGDTVIDGTIKTRIENMSKVIKQNKTY